MLRPSSPGPTSRSRAAAQSIHLFPQRGTLHVTLIDAEGLRAADANGLSDPYATISVGFKPDPKRTILTSKVVEQTLSPTWNEDFAIEGDFDELCRGPLRITIYSDDEKGKYKRLGAGSIALSSLKLTRGATIDAVVPLTSGASTSRAGKARFTLTWQDNLEEPSPQAQQPYLQCTEMADTLRRTGVPVGACALWLSFLQKL